MRPYVPALLLLLAAAPACSLVQTPRSYRGSQIDADQLKELVPGTSTKRDVSSLLGSPSARVAFDDNQWIYISELVRTRVGRTPGVLQQTVTLLTFDDNGVLKDVGQRGLSDSRPVTVVSRTTPSPGSEASFIQQLLGNVGKFNTSPGGAGIGSGSGGSRGPGSSGAQSPTL